VNDSAPAPRKPSTIAPAAAALLLLAASVLTAAAAETKTVDFVRDVQPIFKASCIKCHGPQKNRRRKPAADLNLTDRAAALKGGRSGKVIVPGDAADSLLYKLLSGPVPVPDKHEDKDIPPMPKVRRGRKWKPLPAEQIAMIRAWIDQGAVWPAAPAEPEKKAPAKR
jgi:Planctomycete cytochrome C